MSAGADPGAVIKLAAYYEYRHEGRLHSVRVMGPLSLDEIDLMARFGSEWEDELVVPVYAVVAPGRLVLKVGRTRRPATVMSELLEERARQMNKWGEQNHPDGTGGFPEVLAAHAARSACQAADAGGYLDWFHILREEYSEAVAESDRVRLRAELVQVAAVCVAWVEAIDRGPAPPPPAVTPDADGTVIT